MTNWLSRPCAAPAAWVTAGALAVGFLVAMPAAAPQTADKSGTAREKAAAEARAKPLRRPLLRVGRAQYCLAGLGYYQGERHGRPSVATVRALRRMRADKEVKGTDDVLRDFGLHAILWRLCQPAWQRGLAAAAAAAAPAAAIQPAGRPPGEGAGPAQSGRSLREIAARRACLPSELRDILVRAQGPRGDLDACELPCLPQPAGLDADDARAYERRFAIQWCRQCVPIATPLPLDDIQRIERLGNITLCPEPRRLQRARTVPAGQVMVDQLRNVRGLFPREGRAVERHDHVAVIVANARYDGRVPERLAAERDGAALQAVLAERLGYRPERIIELKNATRADLERVFGKPGSPQGELAARIRPGTAPNVLIYVSGLGVVSDDDGGAALLATDGDRRKEGQSGLGLDTLYQNVTRIGAAAVTIVLEVDFASEPDAPIVAPNAPSVRAALLPKLALRGLTVMTAADRDQRPLDDVEHGLGLFTRYLVAGLAGAADAAPFGNGDGIVDTAEVFVYAAHRTGLAARKTFGMMQKPGLSHGRAMPLGRYAAEVR